MYPEHLRRVVLHSYDMDRRHSRRRPIVFRRSHLCLRDIPHRHLPVSDRHERGGIWRGAILHDLPQSWPGTWWSCRHPLLPGNHHRRVHVPHRSCGDIPGELLTLVMSHIFCVSALSTFLRRLLTFYLAH
ncbi:hypothetical protein ANCCAN_01387 [Ancylostoma caninum]|uniref:Uncharacterized protein n=1 Tax=Ancylostoma caninum TaxID=29170 RepID=A0A368HAS2_ANCCA|nr:hypothetical protein ANCCAN_01387 [Ancylostoma caninum]